MKRRKVCEPEGRNCGIKLLPARAEAALADCRWYSVGGPACGADPAGDMEPYLCLLYKSDAADERSSVDLGGRRIIKKKTQGHEHRRSKLDKKTDEVDRI